MAGTTHCRRSKFLTIFLWREAERCCWRNSLTFLEYAKQEMKSAFRFFFINLWEKINQNKNYRRYLHSVSSDSLESSEASDCWSDSFWSVSLDDSTLRDSFGFSSIFRRFLEADFLSELLLLALLFLEDLTEYKLVLKHDTSLTLKLL